MQPAAAVHTIPAAAPPQLPWDEICARYPNQWIIVVDMVDRDFQVAAARVLAHGPDKHSLVEAGHEAVRRYGHVGRFHTGIPRSWKLLSHVARND